MPVHLWSIKRVYGFSVLDIKRIIFNIKFDPVIKKLVTELRETKDEGLRKDLKLQLPAFSLHNYENSVNLEGFRNTRYLIYDLDDINAQEMFNAIKIIKEFATLMFVSVSGKGLKFAVEMEEEITMENYHVNFRHYKEYFSSVLEMQLCKSYHGLHTFYSHDPDIYYNPDASKYKVISNDVVRKANDIDIETVDSSEIADICHFLKGIKLNYKEWTTVAMALQNVKSGAHYFEIIGSGDTYPDHAHRNWEKKFSQCKSKAISIGSLYWVALDHDYKRREEFIRDGKGKKCPFEMRKDGWYYQIKKDQPAKRMFGWKDIEYLYTIQNMDGSHDLVYKFDKTVITLPGKALNAIKLREIIQGGSSDTFYMTANNYSMYELLLIYLDKINERKLVKKLTGVGRVKENVWSFGNLISFNGKIIPYDTVVWIDEYNGYMIERNDSLEVADCKKPREKLALLNEFYDDWSSIIIGWAVSNLFFIDILRDYSSFPILFFHGITSSGKSKAGDLILSMYGVKGSDSNPWKVSIGNDSTPKSVYRVKDNAYCFPCMYDEYNDGYFSVLKSMFDGTGRMTAMRTTGNEIHKSSISGGSIFASQYKSIQPEALNRCVYVDCNGLKQGKNSDRFQQELILKRNELSSVAISCASKFTYEMWREEFELANTYFHKLVENADSRIITNYAMVYAGYSLLVKFKAIDSWTKPDWWVQQIRNTYMTAIRGSQLERFLELVDMFASQNKGFPYIRYLPPVEPITYKGVKCMILSIDLKKSLEFVLSYDRKNAKVLTLTALDLEKELMSYKWLVKGRHQTQVKTALGESWHGMVYDIAIPLENELS